MPTPIGFDIKSTTPAGASRDPWPEADYPVYISKAETKPTKSGKSGLVEFTLSAVDGPKKGESHAYRLNLFNENEVARRIAQQELTSLAYVCSIIDATTVEEFVGKGPFIAHIGPQLSNNPEDAGKYSEVKHVAYQDGTKPGDAPAPSQTGAITPAAPAQQAATFASAQPAATFTPGQAAPSGFTQQTQPAAQGFGGFGQQTSGGFANSGAPATGEALPAWMPR